MDCYSARQAQLGKTAMLFHDYASLMQDERRFGALVESVYFRRMATFRFVPGGACREAGPRRARPSAGDERARRGQFLRRVARGPTSALRN